MDNPACALPGAPSKKWPPIQDGHYNSLYPRRTRQHLEKGVYKISKTEGFTSRTSQPLDAACRKNRLIEERRSIHKGLLSGKRCF
jgi:hypothetical protein